MSNRWRVVIEAWPYFGVDQAAAGEKTQVFYVHADGAREALTLAEHIVKGIEASPAVWLAPIQGISLDAPVLRKELPPVGKFEIEATKVEGVA